MLTYRLAKKVIIPAAVNSQVVLQSQLWFTSEATRHCTWATLLSLALVVRLWGPLLPAKSFGNDTTKVVNEQHCKVKTNIGRKFDS